MSLIEPNIWERSSTRTKIIVLVGVLVLIAIIFWAFSGGHKDETPLITNIGIDNGKNAVIANLLVNKQSEVNNAVNNAEKVNANLANAILRDSNTFSGNSDDAENAFCSHFPADGSCVEWRKKHGG